MNETHESIQVRFSLELRDVIRAWRYVSLRSTETLVVPLLVLVFVCLGLAVDEPALITGGTSGVLGTAWWGLYHNPRKAFRSAPMLVGNQTWNVGPDIVKFENRDRDGELLFRSETSWWWVWKARETDEAFILMRSANQMAILPKRFLDEHSRNTVSAYISAIR